MTRLPVTYEFGPFRFEADRRVLLRDGAPVAVAPKALETLLALIEHRDRVVTKDELLQRIWGETIVEEGGLARNISVLRKALGEKPEDHYYIVTVPGQGYRFVAEVHESAGSAESSNPGSAGADALVDVAAAAVPPDVRPRPAMRWLVVAGLVVFAVGALVYALRPTSAALPVRPPLSSLAVLPLQNLSGDPSQEYFADGMTEALIATLARVRAVRVVSRTSVMRFKDAPRALPDIARLLNVDAIVEGSVRRTGNRVRIAVQLIHAPSDTHLWAREYERELTDVLKLQSEVARAVAGEIQVRITAEERARLASAGSVNPAAYEEFLLGQHYLWRLTEEDLARAIGHFEHSARLDSGNAATYAALSHAWWWRGIWGATTFRQVESPSRAAAARALELDPALPEAYVSRGRIKFGHERDWAGADQDFTRALEIDPNNVDAHFFSAMLCMALGCFAESIDHMKRVEQRDPLSATVQSFLGRVLYRARRFDEAIIHLNRSIELEPRGAGGAYGRLADVYEAVGRYAEALTVLEKADAEEPRPAIALQRARIYALMGDKTGAMALVDASRERNPQLLAEVYAALGDKDEAFRLLFKDLDERPGLGAYVKTDPSFDSLHSDPRWKEILRGMNFPVAGEP